MNRRRKHGLPFAALAALLFNAALCLAPFIGVRALSNAYGENRPQFETSSQAIAATRQAIDNRFARLANAKDGGEPRDNWANLIREEIDSGDMTTVRGLLLAAPAMLSNSADGQSLKARIAVSNGAGEEALIDAALAYLPEDVQDAYEKRNAPIVSMFSNSAPADAVEGAREAGAGEARLTNDAPNDAAEDAVRQSEFRVLGDLRDLAMLAARWAREDRIDEFAFTLSGVGLILADNEAREGASIALSARRAQRLDPKFEEYLQRKLFAAAPPQRLKRQLVGEFQGEFGYVSNTGVIETVFRASADRAALESLQQDLRVIHEIARDTSAMSAVTILSQVHDGGDLRRAKLIAEAGGDKAVALASYDGEHFLDAARTVITWTNTLRLQVAALAVCFVVLVLISFNVLWRSFMRDRPIRRSAVYGLDEVVPQ
jgi:hypothetical protein